MSAITPNQQTFIRSLVEERMSTLNIDDVEAWLRQQDVITLTSKAASTFIDALKAIPASRKPEHAHLPEGRVVINRYAGACESCGGETSPGAGWCVQTAKGWRTFHKVDECGPRSAAAASIPGAAAPVAPALVIEPKVSYRLNDGTICVGYETQNGYLAVKRLEIDALVYWKGGLAIARRTGGRRLTQEEAADLGRTYGFCCNCGRDLTEDTSLAVGYGPTCAENNGWYYPTGAEAARLLNRA
jgi:hypothetical protein